MSKVTILSRPNRIVIASKGVQGAPGDITPAALAARDAAQEAATQAAESQSTATAAATSAQADAVAAAQSASDAAGIVGPLTGRVDALESGKVDDAPDDGGAYIRVNGQWVQLYAPLALSGDLPDGIVDDPYSATLEASGGRPPYALGDVLLPPGLGATLSDAAVTVAGTPSEEWEGEAHIDLSDSLGTTIRRALNVAIEGEPFTLDSLFSGGADGGFYGFPYLPGEGLFQERTGAAATTPALVGDPVGTIIDKSGNGRHRVAPSDAARPILRQDADGHYYLERDASDDSTRSAATYTLRMPQFILAAITKMQEANVVLGAIKNGTNHHRLLSFSSGRMGATLQGADVSVASASVVTPNNTTPVGTLAIVSSLARASYLDISVNGGTKITAATSWTTQEVPSAYVGDGALALVREYGFLQLAADPGEDARQKATNHVGGLYDVPIFPNSFDVFVLGGQSNMVARADAAGDSHPEGCYQFNGSTITPATVPLDHVDDVAGDMGPDVSFAAAWRAANPGRNILFLPVAEGGTRFGNGGWRKGGANYNRMIARINAVKAAYPGSQIRGILMALGENDTVVGLGATTFQADVDQFLSDMRADTGEAETPVTWGGMAPEWVASNAAYAPYQAVLQSIGERNPFTAYVDSAGVASIAGDLVHMNRAGVLTMGERHFAAMAAAASNSP